MSDNWNVLRRIEREIDKLSWESMSVKIVTKNETYELNKERPLRVSGVERPL